MNRGSKPVDKSPTEIAPIQAVDPIPLRPHPDHGRLAIGGGFDPMLSPCQFDDFRRGRLAIESTVEIAFRLRGVRFPEIDGKGPLDAGGLQG